MLTLTHDAVSAIRDLTAQPDLPDQTGLRIAAQAAPEGASLALSLSAGPEPGDQLVEAEGARVYLDSGAATVLHDKALDVDVSEQGEVRFQVTEQ
jgi:Fe-S cluster assembly iron-binding protein IscA